MTYDNENGLALELLDWTDFTPMKFECSMYGLKLFLKSALIDCQMDIKILNERKQKCNLCLMNSLTALGNNVCRGPSCFTLVFSSL